MRRKKYFIKGIVLFLSVIVNASLADAREWTIIGPRALGMGGANVAVANDATASYWNPAAYGFFSNKQDKEGDYGKRGWSAVLDAGASAAIHEGLGEELDKISKFDYDALNNGQIDAKQVANFLRLVNELKTFNDNKNRALTIGVDGGLNVQAGHWGLGGYAFSEISGKGQLDLVNISPVSSTATNVDIISQFSNTSNFNSGISVPAGNWYLDSTTKSSLVSQIAGMQGWDTTTATNFVQAVDYGLYSAQQAGYTVPSSADVATYTTAAAQLASTAQTGGSFANNQSSLLFKGILVEEIPLTYGYPISEDFSIGGNIKYMKARVYNASVKIFDTNFSDALNNAKNDYLDSTNFGIDIGALYRFGDNLRLGLVGRNLNSPKFDMKPISSGDADNIKEKAQFRTGIAYKPLSFVTMAADIDITKNETTIGSDYKSQNLGGGVELNIFKILQLRGGAYKNLAQSDIGLVYTAGLGLNLWLLNIDLGAAMSSDSNTIDGDSYPKEGKVELAISTLW